MLRRYLRDTGVTLHAFAVQHSLDRIGLMRLMTGERRRVSVDTALAIESATAGAVPVAAWASNTRREVAA